MGGVLETPVKCPLCDELTRDSVALKCNHRFCQRCIRDLWSAHPDGPFCCPEWRCNTSYDTLPFDSIKLWPPNSSSPGMSAKDPTTLVSPLRRTSLASRLLRKRKASTPDPEQPDKKRLSTGERSSGSKTPINSPSDTAEEPPSVEATENGLNAEWDDQSGSYDGDEDDGSQECSQQLNPSENVELVDSDGSTDSDVYVALSTTTPYQDGQVSGDAAAGCRSFTSASTSLVSLSPVQNVSNSPILLPKNAAVASGSPSRISTFAQPESKNTGPVPCHYCTGRLIKQLAVKTCLVCGASMCAEHLRPHMESPVFQSHALVPPVVDISIWRCQEHQEINRIYCRQCAACVCTVCTVIGSHRDHVCISIRDAEQELRGNLKGDINELQRVEQQVKDQVTEFTQKEEALREVLNVTRAGIRQQYAAIAEVLQQEEQSVLKCVEEEESRVVGGLQEKLSLLRDSLRSIQGGLHTLETLVDAKGQNLIRDQAFIMEYRKVPQINMDTLHQLEALEKVNEARLECLQRWVEKRLNMVVTSEPRKDRELYTVFYGTIPIFNANTAHRKLLLSDNDRRVTYTDVQQASTNQDARFSCFPQVLAKHGLQGGRWYWEVDVPVDEGRWKVGVCEESMERKGQRDGSRLGFNASSWCLAYDRRKLEVLHNKTATPVTADGLRRVGVFLDHDGGMLTFFNATPGGSLASMHMYKHRFTGPLYPAVSVSKTQLAICDIFES
ncbi:tripartite motif-containing protein 14 [Festucalex cinctus]